PVIDQPCPEEESRDHPVRAKSALERHQRRADGASRKDLRHERSPAEQLKPPRGSATAIFEQFASKGGMLGAESDIGFRKASGTPHIFRRTDRASLSNNRLAVVTDAVPLKQPRPEIDVFVPVAAVAGKALVEATKRMEGHTADRQMAGEYVERRQDLAAVPVGLLPNPFGDESFRGSGIQGKIADHRVRSRAVAFGVLANHICTAQHVVIDEKDDVAGGLGGAPVS